jgi:fumarate reductase subunit C
VVVGLVRVSIVVRVILKVLKPTWPHWRSFIDFFKNPLVSLTTQTIK